MGENHELWYGEAKQGLDISKSGFTTVKETVGIPSKLRSHMEQLSCFDSYSAFTKHVRYCFSRCSEGSNSWCVLTRASAATGYSQRAGFFSHHVAVHRDNLPQCNPATLMNSLLESSWDGNVEKIQKCRPIVGAYNQTGKCGTWQKVFGDAGAAGELLTQSDRKRSIYVPVPDPSLSLPMIAEALGILPVEQMWQITFSTYFTSDVEREACQIKFYLDPPPKHLSIPKNQIFKFSTASVDQHVSQEVAAARQGKQIEPKNPPAPPRVTPPALSYQQHPKTLKADAVSPQRDSAFRVATATDKSPPEPAPKATESTMPGGSTQEPKSTTLVSGLAGLIIGIVLAAVASLPFVFHFKNQFDNETVDKQGIEQKWLESQELVSKLREDKSTLEKEVRAWRLNYDKETEAKETLLAESANTIRTQKAIAQELRRDLAEIRGDTVDLQNSNRLLARALKEQTKLAQEMNDEITFLKQQSTTNNPGLGQTPKFLKPDAEISDFSEESLDKPIRFSLRGAISSLRVINWPAKKVNGEFGYQGTAGGQKITLYFDKVAFATVELNTEEDFSLPFPDLEIRWKKESKLFWKAKNGRRQFDEDFAEKIKERLYENGIGFMYEGMTRETIAVFANPDDSQQPFGRLRPGASR